MLSPKQPTIGVLLGGTSSERRISLKSGKAVLRALKASGVNVLAVDPARTAGLAGKLARIDLAFIALHGRGGEDGGIQRKLEKLKIPYTGSGPDGSRKAFDKVAAKKIFVKAGIPTPASCLIGRKNWQAALKRFGTPAFAKPVADGSSVGAFPIHDAAGSAAKIRKELAAFGTLLVEKKIEGREFTVGILGQKALPVIELVSSREFFDFKAKYTPGMTRHIVPAKIPGALARKLQKIALRAHQCLGLRDFSRVDIMVDANGKAFVLEANSIPGMTSMSLLPEAARAAGIPFDQLCLQLIQMAARRKQTRKRRAD